MKTQKPLLLIFAVFFSKPIYAQGIGHRYLGASTYRDYWKPEFSPVT